jgi:hypothetical protein
VTTALVDALAGFAPLPRGATTALGAMVPAVANALGD